MVQNEILCNTIFSARRFYFMHKRKEQISFNDFKHAFLATIARYCHSSYMFRAASFYWYVIWCDWSRNYTFVDAWYNPSRIHVVVLLKKTRPKIRLHFPFCKRCHFIFTSALEDFNIIGASFSITFININIIHFKFTVDIELKSVVNVCGNMYHLWQIFCVLITFS